MSAATLRLAATPDAGQDWSLSTITDCAPGHRLRRAWAGSRRQRYGWRAM